VFWDRMVLRGRNLIAVGKVVPYFTVLCALRNFDPTPPFICKFGRRRFLSIFVTNLSPTFDSSHYKLSIDTHTRYVGTILRVLGDSQWPIPDMFD
jgi:hypothetical protein